MIRLMLVDDHAVVREGYRRLLERRGDLSIVAESSTGAEAYRLYQDTQPDVTILDLSLPDIGGVEVIRRLIQWHREARILAFSMHRDAIFVSQALRAGALGYITKSSNPDVLIQAVYQVQARKKVLSPDVAPDLVWALLEDGSQATMELSPREFEVLRLVLAGHSPEDIGLSLHISPKTVQNTHYQIKAKLGVRSDIELMRLAMKLKLLE